ncbi:hypothetical protein BSM4216_3680 [Bacillus smithii]|nr:hypothetical protein BSM4216_3680 [Bacillus smithii]
MPFWEHRQGKEKKLGIIKKQETYFQLKRKCNLEQDFFESGSFSRRKRC